MSAKTRWTPYGLEAIRVGYIRRRRFLALALVLGLMGAWLLMFDVTTTTETSISVNGKEAGGSIRFDVPEQQRDPGPVTVAIDPGRVTRAESTSDGSGNVVQRAEVPTFGRAAPLNWNYFVLLYGPYALLGLALLLLGKRRGRNDEINYGIYKGSMPLEMISASAQRQIFTTREARVSIFGKRRSDYLPREAFRVERVEQEDS